MDQLIPSMINPSSQNGGGHIKQVLLYDLVTRSVPALLRGVGAILSKIVKSRTEKLSESIAHRASTVSGRAPIIGSVILERSYKNNTSNDMFDALLSFVSDLPQAKNVRRTNKGVFTVEDKSEVDIGSDIMFRKLQCNVVEGNIESMVIEIFSHCKNVVHLRDFLTNIEERYNIQKSNSLGRNLYFFDEMPVMLPPTMGLPGEKAQKDLSRLPKMMIFNMFSLKTNKSLATVYGRSVEAVRRRVNFFADNADWYKRKGIPHTLGILLYGDPGCGKTSFVKGLAHDCKRHVVNIKLSDTTTISQINNLFYTNRIHVLQDGRTDVFDIPIDKRIIVMEDIDCLSNVVLDRALEDPEKKQAPQDSEKLTLSVLLNILDGILETPGRIMIMTSNHPEMLDPALIRPGRIDVQVNFTKCSPDDILDMVEGICDVKLDRERLVKQLPDHKWTPAEITKVALENLDDPMQAIYVVENTSPVRLSEKRLSNKTEVSSSKIVAETDKVESAEKEVGKKVDISKFEGIHVLAPVASPDGNTNDNNPYNKIKNNPYKDASLVKAVMTGEEVMCPKNLHYASIADGDRKLCDEKPQLEILGTTFDTFGTNCAGVDEWCK
jgi:hypothetical protein